jgi:acetyltransferase-like isoleucine patch superfamily enzyme
MRSALSQYLRWIKSLYRRLHDDFVNDRGRQAWLAKGVSISPLAIITLGKDCCLEIGKGSMIGAYTIVDLANDPIAKAPAASVLKIGQRTAINEFNNIRAAGGEITIGNNCLISQFVSIIASNHSTARGTPMRDQPWAAIRNVVRVGDDVWVGAHVVVLPGVTIGTGSIVAAGAVVTSDIPAFAVAAGVPARVKKYR